MKKTLFLLFFIFLSGWSFALAENSIDINTATPEQLDEIIGIGPVMARKIISARPFSSIDDLLKVKGIGEKTLQKIKTQGIACVNCEKTKSGDVGLPAGSPTSGAEGAASPVSISYPVGIFINEILPAPEGPDEENEWIEIYNTNNFEVDLSGWQIKDLAGTPAVYAFPESAKIPANGYLVLKRPETKITLNNTEDGLNLVSPDEKMVGSVSFKNAPKSQSYNLKSSGWAWSQSPTPGFQNKISITSATSASLPKTQKSDNNKENLGAASTASLYIPIKKQTNPWFLFLTASIITIISAAIVLFIKIKFKKL